MSEQHSAMEILRRQADEDPQLKRLIEEERVNGRVAELIYHARMHAGISQAELAKRVGTRQSVIARLEDADYEGHSLAMLRRVARALSLPLVIQLGEESREVQHAS